MRYFEENADKERVIKELNLRINALRLSKNMSLDAFSELIETPKATLHRWEKGITNPGYLDIIQIILRTKCNPMFLLFNNRGLYDEVIVLEEKEENILAKLEEKEKIIKMLEEVHELQRFKISQLEFDLRGCLDGK